MSYEKLKLTAQRLIEGKRAGGMGYQIIDGKEFVSRAEVERFEKDYFELDLENRKLKRGVIIPPKLISKDFAPLLRILATKKDASFKSMHEALIEYYTTETPKDDNMLFPAASEYIQKDVEDVWKFDPSDDRFVKGDGKETEG